MLRLITSNKKIANIKCVLLFKIIMHGAQHVVQRFPRYRVVETAQRVAVHVGVQPPRACYTRTDHPNEISFKTYNAN